MINHHLESALWYTKSTLLLVSLVWIIFMLRQMQVQSIQDAKLDMRDNRNHGLVYMKKMTDILNPSSVSFEYFDILYFGAKSQPDCGSVETTKEPILILAANFKQVSDSYLAFYK